MAADMRMTEIVQEVAILTEQTLSTLLMKWRQMYEVDEEFQQRRFTTFIAHVKEMYDSMIDGEEAKLQSMTNEVEQKLTEVVNLERDLEVVIPDVNRESPLRTVIAELDSKMSEFIKIKEDRIKHYEILMEKESELCKILGKEIKPKTSGTPKSIDIENLESYLFELSQLLTERTEYYQEARVRIQNIYSKFALKLQSPFDKELLKIAKPILLNDDYIDQIQLCESSLNENIENLKKDKAFKLDRIKKLWDQLNVPVTERDEFLNLVEDNLSPSTFDKLSVECARCEVLRSQNIEPLILSTKQKILDIWEKLKYSDQQKQEFCPFYTPYYTEEVLGILEFHLEKLTTQYNDNIELYELVDKWSTLWDRRLHLEELAKDKTRLHNRGGLLLKEEKERKSVEKNLPKIYDELVKMIKEFEEKSGAPFIWNGENFLEKLQQDWHQREISVKKESSSDVASSSKC